MKTFSVSLLRAVRAAALVAAASTGGLAMAEPTTFDAGCVPRLDGVQQRLFDKADDGPAALRDYMFIRRGILQLDIYETGAWADTVKEGRTACMKQLARLRALPGAATRMADSAASAPAR